MHYPVISSLRIRLSGVLMGFQIETRLDERGELVHRLGSVGSPGLNPEYTSLRRIKQGHLHGALAVDGFGASRHIANRNGRRERRCQLDKSRHRTQMQPVRVGDRRLANGY